MRKKVLLIVVTLMITGLSRQLYAQDMALKTNILYDLTSTINLGYEVALNHKTTLDIWLNYNPWTLGGKWVGLFDSELPKSDPTSAFKRDSKLKHLAIQPEIRWWMCEKFNGHFIGVHLHGGLFNVGVLKLPFDWGRYKDSKGDYLGSYPETLQPYNYPNVKVQGVAYHVADKPYPGLVEPDGTVSDVNAKYWGNADRDGIYVNSFEGWLLGAGVSYGYHLIMSPRFSMEFTFGLGYAYLKYEKTRCTDCRTKLGEEVAHYFGPTRAGISLVYMLK